MIEHLSPSTVQSYRTCGRQVYFGKILNVENPSHYAMTEYGTSMHKAIELLYKHKLSLGEFKGIFEGEWKKNSETVNRWKNDSYEYLLGEGFKACDDFFNGVYGKYDVVETEQVFRIDRGEGKLPILCFADAITSDGIVIDYKFGRGLRGTADSRGYTCNMATYAWGYKERAGELPKKIVFIKQKWKNRRDKETGTYIFSHDGFVIDEKDVTEEDLEFYKNVYDNVEAGINANVWLPAPDESFLCKSCGYRLNGMCNRQER